MPKPVAQKPNTTFTWFDIFKAGTHTDSKGNTQEFTQQDLESVVANFNAKTAPLVIGHPKMDDPAWGWTSELKVDGGVLYAKAEDVSAEFAQAVEDKRYPNRSVRLNKIDNGYQLGHIGFLGGKPPAVDGLSWQFSGSDDNALDFDFAASEKIESVSLQTSNVVTRLWNNLREFLVDKYGTETADRVVPQWDSEWLKEQPILAEQEKRQQRNNQADSTEFAAPEDTLSNNPEETDVTDEEKKALEDKLKAEQDKNKKLEYAQRVQQAQTFIDTQINSGKAPRLTNTEGVAEFMASLESDDAQTFEFAAADGEKTEKPGIWFKSFLQGLPQRTGLTKDFSKEGNDDDKELDAQALASKALEFQKSEADKGITISISSAMQHVNQEK